MSMSALSFRRLGAAWRAAPAVAASSRLLCTDALTTPAESGKAVGSVERKPQLDSRAVSAFTGTPKELLDKRVVTIYQPAPGVQTASKGCWKISWDDENTQRWSNPLMGWTSTRDPFSNTPMTLEFHSAEDAIRFVQNNGTARPLPSHPPSPSPTTAVALGRARAAPQRTLGRAAWRWGK